MGIGAPGRPSVVVHNLHIIGPAIGPDEANSPLVVDADTVLTPAIAAKGFKVIAGRAAQIGQFAGVVQHDQLKLGAASKLG